MPPRRRCLRALLLLSALSVSACAYLHAQGKPAVDNPELVELSGLTRSLATDDWLWAHNDSGDTARLFRVGPHGEDGGVVTVLGADANDWEDIASFRWQGQPALLIGDIGDNLAWRDHISLYAVADPGATGSSTKVLWQLDVRYPDGPRDAEGLAVDPLSGDILILSKRERPPKIYRVAMPTAPPTATVTAEIIGPLLHIPKPTPVDLADDPIYGWLRDWPTALDIAPDGLSVVVTTYKTAYRYWRQPGQAWAQVFAQKPQTIVIPQFKQTEAGAISNDGRWLYVGSEQRAGYARVLLPPPPPNIRPASK